MQRKMEKSPEPGHVLRIVMDLTKEETITELKGMDQAIATGAAAQEARKVLAQVLKG